LAKSQADISLLSYQQAALNAFAEVENSQKFLFLGIRTPLHQGWATQSNARESR